MQATQLTVSQFLTLEYSTYDMLFSAHTGKNTYLCREIVDGVVRMLMDAVCRAADNNGPLESWADVPVSRLESDIIDYLFSGYRAA